MQDKKQLNEEELEKVTGGCAGTEGVDTGGAFTDFIGMYELHNPECFGKEYYFVKKKLHGYTWFKALLVNSYEAWNFPGTNCTHDIRVTFGGNDPDYNTGDKDEIYGDNYAAYKTMT